MAVARYIVYAINGPQGLLLTVFQVSIVLPALFSTQLSLGARIACAIQRCTASDKMIMEKAFLITPGLKNSGKNNAISENRFMICVKMVY